MKTKTTKSKKRKTTRQPHVTNKEQEYVIRVHEKTYHDLNKLYQKLRNEYETLYDQGERTNDTEMQLAGMTIGDLSSMVKNVMLYCETKIVTIRRQGWAQ
jgi:hypothetical protein